MSRGYDVDNCSSILYLACSSPSARAARATAGLCRASPRCGPWTMRSCRFALNLTIHHHSHLQILYSMSHWVAVGFAATLLVRAATAVSSCPTNVRQCAGDNHTNNGDGDNAPTPSTKFSIAHVCHDSCGGIRSHDLLHFLGNGFWGWITTFLSPISLVLVACARTSLHHATVCGFALAYMALLALLESCKLLVYRDKNCFVG
mmetsp:Transcript_30346/g.83062  ORF Transcript_30346/g.83062 Transcript_30346/m.83062 type:complete len:203 (+) Transcript_30346:141-749(+)